MPAATNEQLMLLHQELAALARAGLPLDSGLRALAHELPGRLGQLATALAARLERGEDIAEALRTSGTPDERVYAAVIAAGIRSGRLAEALESVVATAAAGNELRRSLWTDLAYPLLLLVLGYALLVVSLIRMAPVDLEASDAFDARNSLIDGLESATSWLGTWGYLAPIAIVASCGLLIWLVRRSTGFGSNSWSRGPLARFRREQSLQRFFDVLALLVEHSIPLPEALVLAGEASGWTQLAAACEQLSSRLRRGESIVCEPPIPPTIAWLSTSDAVQAAKLFRREAEHHQARAREHAAWTTRWLPLLITLAIGLTYVVLLAAVNLAPFINLLYRLSRGG
jgi:general secretion pathway protein F